jgi:polysaccharide export outer membrane protein
VEFGKTDSSGARRGEVKILRLFTAVFLSLAFLPAAGVLGAQEAGDGHAATPEVLPSKTVIGPDDGITIVALESEEMSKTWRVNSSGELDLPMVGKIHAAGLTTDELEQTLTEKLRRYVRDPQVTVYVSEFRSQPVTVAGGVAHPGTLQIEGPKTLLTVLMMAGGPNTSGPTVTITRDVHSAPFTLPGSTTDADGQHMSLQLKMKDVLDPSSSASNLEIRANDIVAVSSQKQLVYIIGEVNHPGAVELVTQDAVSIMQVLAAAGGLTKLAAPHSTQIMRVNQKGLYEKIATIDVKRVMSGKMEDRLLTAGDIIVVPSSALKAYTQTAGMTALTTSFYILTRF